MAFGPKLSDIHGLAAKMEFLLFKFVGLFR